MAAVAAWCLLVILISVFIRKCYIRFWFFFLNYTSSTFICFTELPIDSAVEDQVYKFFFFLNLASDFMSLKITYVLC